MRFRYAAFPAGALAGLPRDRQPARSPSHAGLRTPILVEAPLNPAAAARPTPSMTTQDEVIQAYEDARLDVYYYMLRLGLNPPEAQETSQEVFLRLFVALQNGEDIRNKRAWIFRVAHNLGLNQLKSRGRWQPLDPLLEHTLPDRRPGPDESLMANQRSDSMQRALADLSPQQRQCLHLRAEGLRYREIAETIGVGVSTVGEFLSRAIARLRRAVDE